MTERVCKVGTDCDVTCFCLDCTRCFDHCDCLADDKPLLELSLSVGYAEMDAIRENVVARDAGHGPGTKSPGEDV